MEGNGEAMPAFVNKLLHKLLPVMKAKGGAAAAPQETASPTRDVAFIDSLQRFVAELCEDFRGTSSPSAALNTNAGRYCE